MMPTRDDNIVREYLHSSLEFMGVNLSAEIRGTPGDDPQREGIHHPPQLGRIRDLLNADDVTSMDTLKRDTAICILKSNIAQLS